MNHKEGGGEVKGGQGRMRTRTRDNNEKREGATMMRDKDG